MVLGAQTGDESAASLDRVAAVATVMVDGDVCARIETPLPWGTFAVNILGSFLLGLLTGVGNHTIALLVGVGFCGAFTTYSTFAAETTALASSGHRGKAVLNVVLNLGTGLVAAVAGAWLSK